MEGFLASRYAKNTKGDARGRTGQIGEEANRDARRPARLVECAHRPRREAGSMCGQSAAGGSPQHEITGLRTMIRGDSRVVASSVHEG
jgi:hypothetical protein